MYLMRRFFFFSESLSLYCLIDSCHIDQTFCSIYTFSAVIYSIPLNFWIMQSSYFEPTDVCPESQELVEHSTITTIRCGKCKKLNPNFQVPATGSGSTPPKHVNDCSQKTQPLTGREIIVVEDESPSAKSETILPLIPPARRRALATAIPSLPDFKIGYAEAERQHVNQIVADRRPKTNFATPSPLVYFGLSIAHFEWDSNIVDDLGTWKSSNNQWSINENNRYLTYQGKFIIDQC